MINYSDVAWKSHKTQKMPATDYYLRTNTWWLWLDYMTFLAWIGEDDCLKASFNNANVIVILAAVKSPNSVKKTELFCMQKHLPACMIYPVYNWIQPLIHFFHGHRMVDFCHVKSWYTWYIVFHCVLSAGDSYATPRLTNIVLFGRRTDDC